MLAVSSHLVLVFDGALPAGWSEINKSDPGDCALSLRLDQSRPTADAVKPVARTDANSRTAHEQLLQKAKKGGIDVYFNGVRSAGSTKIVPDAGNVGVFLLLRLR